MTTYKLALRAKVIEEHKQLQLEEDDWVHRRPAAIRVERPHKLPHEREVQTRLQAPVEVVFWEQVLQREVAGRSCGSWRPS